MAMTENCLDPPVRTIYPWERFSTPVVLGVVFGLPALVTDAFAMGWFASLILFGTLVFLLGLPTFALGVFAYSYSSCPSETSMGITKYAQFTDEALNVKYRKTKVPITTLHKYFVNFQLDIESTQLLELMSFAQYFVRPVLTPSDMYYIIRHVLPSFVTMFDMPRNAKFYDQGPDFFKRFLGPSMVHSCGFFNTLSDDLKLAQKQKLELVCQKLQMQPTDTLLDIGCGFGSLIMHATRRFGLANATGLTTSAVQKEFADEWIHTHGHKERTRIIVTDFAQSMPLLPFRRYKKIACVEMAEELGLRGSV